MSQQNPPQKEGQKDESKQQQQQSMKKPTRWSIDFSSICGDGNGKNALKVRKWEFLAGLLCILMVISICVILLFMATPSKGASMGEQQTENGNGTLLTEIDLLRAKNGQMAEEANAQKALEKAQNETIAQLRATNEQQAKEIGQMLEEKNSKVKKLTGLEQLGEIAQYLILILSIIIVCLLIIALLVLPCWFIYDCCRYRF